MFNPCSLCSVIMNVLLGYPVNSKQFGGCILGFDYNGITPLEDTNIPNIVKSPGLVEGSCDVVIPPTDPPRPDTTPAPDNNSEEDGNEDGEDNNNNEVEEPEVDKPDNNSTMETQIKGGGSGLKLPLFVILAIAAGGFICILVIVYGVSRFARRRQGVYRTNEEKRSEMNLQRVDYDKLNIHEEAFQLPSKRELYM